MKTKDAGFYYLFEDFMVLQKEIRSSFYQGSSVNARKSSLHFMDTWQARIQGMICPERTRSGQIMPVKTSDPKGPWATFRI